MAEELQTEPVASMKKKRFGKLLQQLRGPDVAEYRYKSALSHLRKHRRNKKKNEFDLITEMEREELFKRLNIQDPYKDRSDEDRAKELQIRVWLPSDFREYHQFAAKLGMKFKSLRETAKLIGINKNTLHDYETGKRYPPAEFVFEFCNALGLSPEKLMRDWIGFHPDPIISNYVTEGRYAPESVWEPQSGYAGEGLLSPDDENIRQFIANALKLSAFMVDLDLWENKKIHKIAYLTAYIIHDVLSEALPLHPKNIDTNPFAYNIKFPDGVIENSNVVSRE
ncbi:helix-turn-helix domain-containing protein [Thiolapillus sp.]|uniref:helix-turn-helix domain-containing protein n=4 Tax=Thiolapillus sp. TaxID=2017437 RepID=UPI0025FC7F31|nr:helix-turn-helix transcriptional regulator [Thiolapillus sp.]